MRNAIDMDGDWNTVADALTLDEAVGQVGVMWLGGHYVDVRPCGQRVQFVYRHLGGRDEVIGDFARETLLDVMRAPLCPFVYRMVEVSGLLEVS